MDCCFNYMNGDQNHSADCLENGNTTPSGIRSDVTLTLNNGDTLEFMDVLVDSIGPRAESPGVIGIEFNNDPDRIVHVPWVKFWEIRHVRVSWW